MPPHSQVAVHAVLDILESDDPLRFDLPVPLTAMQFAELKTLKLERRRAPRARRTVTVVEGRDKRRSATHEEEEAIAGTADAMLRKALLEAGSTETGIAWWFTPSKGRA